MSEIDAIINDNMRFEFAAKENGLCDCIFESSTILYDNATSDDLINHLAVDVCNMSKSDLQPLIDLIDGD